jgi:DNA-binding MarR family transcriptional regulator
MLEGFDKAFENKVRLGIMSILMVNEQMDFNSIKDLMKLTDGNLASHAAALEKVDYIEVHKSFVGRKTQTNYKATKKGKDAFNKHLKALEDLLKNNS